MPEPFHVYVRGHRYEACYSLLGNYLVVRSLYGSMRAPSDLTGVIPVRKMAKTLLRAILRDAQITTARLAPPRSRPMIARLH